MEEGNPNALIDKRDEDIKSICNWRPIKEEVNVVPSDSVIQNLLQSYRVASEVKKIPTIEELRKMTNTARNTSVYSRLVTLPDISRPPPGYQIVPPVQVVHQQPQDQGLVSTVVGTVLAMMKVQPQVNLLEEVKVVVPKVEKSTREISSGKRRSSRNTKRETEEGYVRSKYNRHYTPEKRHISPMIVEGGRRVKRSYSRSLTPPRKILQLSPGKTRRQLYRRGSRAPELKIEDHRDRYREDERSREYLHHRNWSGENSTSPYKTRPESKPEEWRTSNEGRWTRERSYSGFRETSRLIEGDLKLELENKKYEDSWNKRRLPVKDRLGTRPENVEMFNMDQERGKCGVVAVVKEFIDSKTGLLEVMNGPGVRGAVVLFHSRQFWLANRQVDPNGPPIRYQDTERKSLHKVIPVGQEVLINARKVDSRLVDLQATVVWPKCSELPRYTMKIHRLDEQLVKLHQDCLLDTMVPLCINGLAPVGSLNIWSAKVNRIVDKDWGIVEVKSVPRDGKREFQFNFFCVFNKMDLWMADGLHVASHEFFRNKSLSELVELGQPVNIVARSIVRLKGQAMKKIANPNLEMQALVVSLNPSLIPKAATLGTKVAGGPGAFGGSNRGETPYRFEVRLKKKLDEQLAKFTAVSGKAISNLDPSIIVVDPDRVKEGKKVIHLIGSVHDNKPDCKYAGPSLPPLTDKQNNVEPVGKIDLADKLSNVSVKVKQYLDDETGLLKDLTNNWMCVFQLSDCVISADKDNIIDLYPVGIEVQVNANLIDSNLPVQYMASSVWSKSANSIIIPNNIDGNNVSDVKLALYQRVNTLLSRISSSSLPEYLEMVECVVLKILDKNFGLLQQIGTDRKVLFDTCDLWTGSYSRAVDSKETLSILLKVGDNVFCNAALIQSKSSIPYLATAVWQKAVFTSGQHPEAILRESIVEEKIRIYKMVSRSYGGEDDVKDRQEEKSEVSVISDCVLGVESPNREALTGQIFRQKGVVKVAFKWKLNCPPFAGVIEFDELNRKSSTSFAFFLSENFMETHERARVCVPGTKVYFNAIPYNQQVCSLTHIVTTLSHVHKHLPIKRDSQKAGDVSDSILMEIAMKNKVDLKNLASVEPGIILLDNEVASVSPVIVCQPTGRLVCMLNNESGILEDHNRELAYFELSDVNLGSKFEMKDVVLAMTRCRDVTIRFQASQVLSGPVRNIVHDGTVALSQNVTKYFKQLVAKEPKTCNEPNSYSVAKLDRAKNAIELYKTDQSLSPDYIIESGQFPSVLEKEVAKKDSSESVRTVVNMAGRVKNILNDNFGLIEFEDSQMNAVYCLFDTYDLYTEEGEASTAALNRMSVANVLSIDMEVCFNACELLPPVSPVPWLATGVWLASAIISNKPDPVDPASITKEKVAVFKRVADTCSVFVSGMVVPTESSRKINEFEELTSKLDESIKRETVVKSEDFVDEEFALFGNERDEVKSGEFNMLHTNLSGTSDSSLCEETPDNSIQEEDSIVVNVDDSEVEECNHDDEITAKESNLITISSGATECLEDSSSILYTHIGTVGVLSDSRNAHLPVECTGSISSPEGVENK